MKCLICLQKIQYGEHVFWGSQMVCDGPGYADFHDLPASDDSMGVVHLSCLRSPAAIAKTPNSAIPEFVDEECGSIVERSDALSLFD